MEREKENWTEVISPKINWFDLKLAEVWRYRDLVLLFVKRDFVAAHKQTVLGGLWHIITPFINMILYTVVFNTIANLTTEGIPPFLFQTVSYTTWAYFVGTFGAASGTFGNAGLFSKVYFPRLSVPLASCLSSLIRLLIQFLITLLVWAYYYTKGYVIIPTVYLLGYPLLLLIFTLIGMGSGLVLASLTSKYRDLNNFIGYGVAAMMYASAVVYPLSQIPELYRPLTTYNPLINLMEATRYAFFGTGSWDWAGLAIAGVFGFVMFLAGVILFNKAERNFIDTV